SHDEPPATIAVACGDGSCNSIKGKHTTPPFCSSSDSKGITAREQPREDAAVYVQHLDERLHGFGLHPAIFAAVTSPQVGVTQAQGGSDLHWRSWPVRTAALHHGVCGIHPRCRNVRKPTGL